MSSETDYRSPFLRFSPHVSFIWGLDSYFSENRARNETMIEKMKGEKKQNVRKVKMYYKESEEERKEEKVRRRDRGEWQMDPKKRGLLGSALRQSWAYDSFTVGSVCVFAHVCASWLNLLCVYWDVSVCVFMHILMFVPWHGASVYLRHFLCVEHSQRDSSSTCYPFILLPFLTSSCQPSLYWLN